LAFREAQSSSKFGPSKPVKPPDVNLFQHLISILRSYAFQAQKWAVLDVGGQKDGPMPKIASGESDPAKAEIFHCIIAVQAGTAGPSKIIFKRVARTFRTSNMSPQ
tara:strand:+ start:402 stop:719 length:318 start_codon:yes stop_codon:yes gene_type:complete